MSAPSIPQTVRRGSYADHAAEFPELAKMTAAEIGALLPSIEEMRAADARLVARLVAASYVKAAR